MVASCGRYTRSKYHLNFLPFQGQKWIGRELSFSVAHYGQRRKGQRNAKKALFQGRLRNKLRDLEVESIILHCALALPAQA